MCKISKYAGLYMKVAEELRFEGLNPKTPGYEMLKVAIVVFNVNGSKHISTEKEDEFYSEVEASLSSPVPSINPVVTERHPVKQWMTEALREKGIEDTPLSFIEDIASKISPK